MVLSIGIQQSQSCWSSLVVQTRGLVYAQWLLACMSKNASKWGDEETGRLCVYICMWGRFAFAFFFLQSFQMAILSVQMRVILGFFTAWLHIMLSVLTSFI